MNTITPIPMQEGSRYVPNRALRVSMQRYPEVAEWRCKFARAIWKARREHPGMDKLLWRAYCNFRLKMVDQIFGSGNLP